MTIAYVAPLLFDVLWEHFPTVSCPTVSTDGPSSPAPTQGPSPPSVEPDASSDSAEGSRSFAAGAIVGASVGGVVLLIAVAAGATCCVYRRRHRPSESHGPDKTALGISGEESRSAGQQGGLSSQQGIESWEHYDRGT